MKTYNHFRIKPITGAMGAEVFDIDLSLELDDETFAEITSAFQEHLALIFRDQNLTDQQQYDFSARFGPIIPHPFVQGLPEIPEIFQIIREPGEAYSWDGNFHTDLQYLKNPPLGATLYCKACPPYGADTAFSNMYLAFETLSKGMQALLEGLEGVNESGDPKNYSTGFKSMTELDDVEALSGIHPMVRVHPDTGRKALFSSSFTKRFNGMTHAESRPLLDFLYEHSTQPHLGCRLTWQPNSLALWDNRVSIHHGVGDYFGEVAKHRRVMQRATIEGEVPIPAQTVPAKAA